MKGAGTLAQAFLRVYLRKPRAPVVADVLGSKMRLDPAEAVDRVILFYPQFQDHCEIDFLSRQLRPGDLFLDVGAHIGFYTLAASRRVGPDGLVLAFEADPRTHQGLLHNLQLNNRKNVRAYNLGVSDKQETLRLGVGSAGNKGAHSFLFNEGEGIDVPCQPLLTLLQQNGITTVKGAKFDIEGYEYRVLSHFLANADRAMLPEFIITEFFPEWVEAAAGDAIALLKGHGYRVHTVTKANYILVRT